MRTKTTILSAVALAAGLLSASAQVYSANVVGYYNITVPGGLLNHGVEQALISNQLTNNNNDISSILTSGVVSDPNGTFNTIIAFWSGTAYTTLQYFTDPDALNNFGASSGNGWYDPNGVIFHTALPQGGAAFLQNPLHTNLTVTIVGQVVQGSYSVPIQIGNHTFSLIPPVSTNIDSFPTYPGVSDPNGTVNDVLAMWNPTIQGYQTVQWFTSADANSNFGASFGDGWYDPNGVLQSTNKLFQPTVGQGFFIQRFSGGTSNWVYSFTVQ